MKSRFGLYTVQQSLKAPRLNINFYTILNNIIRVKVYCINIDANKRFKEAQLACKLLQPRFYCMGFAVAMKYATPMTPPSVCEEFTVTPTQHTMLDTRVSSYKITMRCNVVRGDFLQPPHKHQTLAVVSLMNLGKR